MHTSHKIGGLPPSRTPVTPLFWRSCTIRRRNSFVSKILQLDQSLTHLFARLCDFDTGGGGSAFPHRWPLHTQGHQTLYCGDPSTLQIILAPLPHRESQAKGMLVPPQNRPGEGMRTMRSEFSWAAMLLVATSALAQTVPPAAAPPTAGQGRPPMAAIGVPVAGMPFVHDPSTVARYKGKYYVYSTGRGIPFYSSPDLVTWTREGSVFEKIPDAVHAGVPKNDGTCAWARDIVRVGGEFYLYYAVSSWGSFQSAIGLATNPVLDPKDPAYKWTDRGVVVSSSGTDDLNAIDPGVIWTREGAPDGTLWICYGSYHGSIRITQLDPKTGLALRPKELGAAIATARESEASDLIFHDGYYYLFVNHNSCCKGKNSEYNIRVGRSRSVTGPYLDKHGEAMAKGGGSMFLAAHDHRIGPGHFGRVLDYDASADGAEGGPERFSIHYEADMTRNGRSVLDVRPLLWSLDGWPVAGDNLTDGTYQIVSRQSENTLEARVPR